ncbi:S-adenosyl-methyltransferase MraW [Phytophthora nicotianae P10297]|uniref:S-adenosyl-methyltransferase MraW n=2 Tax=Phytophthora nicotianae TaxID=4792 RepID=W2Y941_PHYNI|nr:S-adenosyl-methyltransferase MraW [Phytophthora nicotianae]ETP31600.1 S-adenosyl-methyltransferase MraW [Phytophthora nicotianae P10297]
MLLLRLHSSAALRASRVLPPLLQRSVPHTGSCVSFSTSQSASDGSQPPVHVPVLLQETVAALSRNVSDDSKPHYFVDGTAGFGGHSRTILQRFPEAKLLCIDRDPEVLSIAKANLAEFHGRVIFQNGSYAELAKHLEAAEFPDEVDGILVDLGANSFHFDAARRGFSVLNDGPLDMRFNQRDSTLPTAADAVNTLSEVQLTKIFRDYGEERLAKEFAKAIVREREERGKVFETTRDLRECIERIANMWKSGDKTKKKKKSKRASKLGSTHPATRCFQALRIYVNDELYHVDNGVKQLVNHLAPHGRLVTIAFHSLEDRPIKDFFRDLDMKGRIGDDEEDEWEYEDIDEEDEDEEIIDPLKNKRFRLPRRKATKATDEEIAINSRSRSARLRCIERIL